MLLDITSTGNGLLRIVNIDDLDWPWALKTRGFSDLLTIFCCRRVNCDEMDGDRPRFPANRNCYRLSCISWALAQISCSIVLYSYCCSLKTWELCSFYSESYFPSPTVLFLCFHKVTTCLCFMLVYASHIYDSWTLWTRPMNMGTKCFCLCPQPMSIVGCSFCVTWKRAV